mgnify:CR=1 FL=1
MLRACWIVAALSIAAWMALRSTEAPVSDAATPIAPPTTATAAPKAGVALPREDLSSPEESHELAREAVENENATEFDDAAKLEGLALLRVLVVSKETGAPVAAAAVAALKGDSSEIGGAGISVRSRGRAQPGEAVKTDAKGRAELLVQPYVEHRARVFERQAFDEVLTARALQPGETLELRFEIRAEPDWTFLGLVVDGQTQHPIVDASVHLLERHSTETLCDANGAFELRLRSWDDYKAEARAPGYAPAQFGIEHEWGARDRRFVVVLWREASLEVTAIDGAAPVGSFGVHLLAGLGDPPKYRTGPWLDAEIALRGRAAGPDSDGVARFDGLPARIAFRLSIYGPDSQRVVTPPIRLEPGENRRIEAQLASTARISGRVELAGGRPLADVEVWLVAATSASETTTSKSYHKPAATTRTDGQGRFTFEDVSVGVWWVGIAPRARDKPSERAIPSVAKRAEVQHGVAVPELLFRVDEGLFLRGVVRTPSGATTAAIVFAHHDDGSFHESSGAKPNGTFELGPLPAGSYLVTAFDSALAPSDPLRAQAGEQGLELHLREPGELCVRVVDTEGRSVDAEVRLRAQRSALSRSMSSRDSVVEFKQLGPDTWSVVAEAAGNQLAVRTGLLVSAGQRLDVELRLEPAARLTITYSGPLPNATYELHYQGAVVRSDGLLRDQPATWVVPAGELELRRVHPQNATPETHVLKLTAGEVRELVVGG